MTICFVEFIYLFFFNAHLDFTSRSQLCRKAQTETQAKLRVSSKYIKAVKNIHQTKGRSITKWKLKALSIMSMQILKMVLLSCLSDPFEDVDSKEKKIMHEITMKYLLFPEMHSLCWTWLHWPAFTATTWQQCYIIHMTIRKCYCYYYES